MRIRMSIESTEHEKEQARQKIFVSMNLNSTGAITFHGWSNFSMEHILAKTFNVDPHPP
jgi:hypothetical protein